MEIIAPDSDLGRKLRQLDQLAKDIRAPFLDQALAIELILSDIISHHFCPDEKRRSLFFSLVINELTFSLKTKIFKGLLKLECGDLLRKHPRVIHELNKVRDFRNWIAHAHLDNSMKFLSKGFRDRIQLVDYKKGRERKKVVTFTERDERLRACSQLALGLKDIQNEVIKRVSG